MIIVLGPVPFMITVSGPLAAATTMPGPPTVITRYAYASGDGQEQTRFRSPNAPSIRPTGGKYLCAGDTPAGKTASALEYG